MLRSATRDGEFDVYFAPLAILFSPRRELQPDLLVVPRLEGQRIRDERDLVRLVLAVEVLSPSTARHDRVTKRRVYQEQGVAEYWVVDTEARLVERWCPGDARPEILTKVLSWTPPGGETALQIDLETLFREALN